MELAPFCLERPTDRLAPILGAVVLMVGIKTCLKYLRSPFSLLWYRDIVYSALRFTSTHLARFFPPASHAFK